MSNCNDFAEKAKGKNAIQNMPLSCVRSRPYICSIDHHRLVKRKASFYIKHKTDRSLLIIEDELYYCDTCGGFFANKKLCRDIIAKFPGYKLELGSMYKGQNSAKRYYPGMFDREKPQLDNDSEANEALPENTQDNADADDQATDECKLLDFCVPLNRVERIPGMCPKCCSVLAAYKLNVPTVDDDGDFQGYIVGNGAYCYQCKEGFIAIRALIEIMQKERYINRRECIVLLKDGYCRRNVNSSYSDDYLYYPTLDSRFAVTIEKIMRTNTRRAKVDDKYLRLNIKSFLGEKGYSVSVSEQERRTILYEAVSIYGRRKVTKHIKWLRDMSLRRYNGAERYHSAIAIWQSDLNYIFKL